MQPRNLANIIIIFAVACGSFLYDGIPAAAATTFNKIFSVQDNGAIRLFGNSNMQCPVATGRCSDALAGTAGIPLDEYNNNFYIMQWVDVDSDPTTINSSTAKVELPANSTLLYARLVWGGNTGGSLPRNSVKIKANNGTYQTVTAATGDQRTINTYYQSAADVTSIVKAGGNGDYTVANISSIDGQKNRFAGWGLVLAFRNPGEPLRDLSIFEGLDDVSGSESTSISISGFLTPRTGPVNASLGMIAWEGDLGLIGDKAKLNTTILSNPAHPADNYFNSAISDPAANSARNPSYVNGMGVDVSRIDASGIISNSATSATLSVSTSGDAYLPGIISTQVDLFAPGFAPITKAVVNLNGHDPAWVGDTLEYTISLSNTGTEASTQSVVSDQLPANLSYVAGSINYPGGTTGNIGVKTDASGDDQADYNAATRTVTARVGTGASSTSGGTLAPSATAAIRFRATIDVAAAGTTIANSGQLRYLAPTINKTYTYITNTVTTAAIGVADLKIIKETLNNPITDNPVHYRLTATNTGPSPATNVTISDTFAAGMTPTTTPTTSKSTPCSLAGQTLTCAGLGLAVNESVSVEISMSLSPTAGLIDNSAQVTADQPDANPANNTDSTHADRPLATDIVQWGALYPIGSATPSNAFAAGEPFLVHSTGWGPAAGLPIAENTVVQYDLPIGFRYLQTDSGASCTATAQRIICPIGDVSPGFNWNIYIRVVADPSYPAGPAPGIVVRAISSTPETNLANNTATHVADISIKNNLAVNKTADQPSFVAGSTASYTVTMSNTGPSTAYDPVLSETPMVGLSDPQVAIDRGSCTTTASSLSCTIATLAPGEVMTAHISWRIPADRLGLITNSASVTRPDVSNGGPESNLSDNSTSTSTSLDLIHDLSLVKVARQASFNWGDAVEFDLAVHNAGPSTAHKVIVTDNIPVGSSYIPGSASSNFTNCSVSGQTLKCEVTGTIGPGQTKTAAIKIQTPGSNPFPPQGLTNTAEVNFTQINQSNSETDPQPSNNSPATTVSTGTMNADLSVIKTVDKVAAIPGNSGDLVVYTLTVTNNGPSNTADFTITDTLPALFKVDLTGSSSGLSVAGHLASYTGPGLSSGSSTTVTIAGRFAPEASGRVTNSVRVSPTTSDDSPNNNLGTVDLDLAPLADLALTFTPDAMSLHAGLSYPAAITVSNGGPSTAINPIVRVVLAAGVRPESLPNGCQITDQVLICQLVSLSPGATVPINLNLKVLPGASPATNQISTATVGSSTPESNSSNNSAQALTTITNDADLTIQKTIDTSPLIVGSKATYTILVTNQGTSDTLSRAEGVVIKDQVPTGLTVQKVTMIGGNCASLGQDVTCQLMSVLGKQVLTMTVDVVVGSEVVSPVNNQATLDWKGDTTPDTSSGVSTTVTSSADLVITKKAIPSIIIAGESVQYVIQVENRGPSAADALVKDFMPSGLQILPAGIHTDTGNCAAVVDPAGNNPDELRCNLGILASGNQANITVTAYVSDTLPAVPISNTATVTSPVAGPADHRTASITTSVQHEADLAVIKYPTTDIPVAGREFSYVISGVNNGPTLARSVTISDTIPAGTSFVAADPSQGSCAGVSPGGTGTISCSFGDLVRGEAVSIRLSVKIAPDAGNTNLDNSASISSSTPEAKTSDNTSHVVQEIIARSLYTMTKTPAKTTFVPGEDISWTITARNDGPSDATNAYITDAVPAGTDFKSISIDGSIATCTLQNVYDDNNVATGVTYYQCTHGNLKVGETMTMTFVVTAKAYDPLSPVTAISNEACGFAETAVDFHPCATSTLTLAKQADLAIKITGLPTAPTGSELIDTIEITNLGPDPVADYYVDLSPPSGVTTGYVVEGAVCSTSYRCTIASPLGTGQKTTIKVRRQTDPAGSAGTISSLIASVGLPPGGVVFDPSLTNNTAKIDTTLSRQANLTIAKAASPNPIIAGKPVSYTLTINNPGPSTATTIVADDDLPAGLTYRTSSSSSGSCSFAAGRVHCSTTSLAVGASWVITIEADSSSSVSGTMINEATASAAEAAQVSSGKVMTTVDQEAAFILTKTANQSSVVAGTTMDYTLRLENKGPSAAEATITDILPAELATNSTDIIAPTGVTCTVDEGRGISCSMGLMAPSSSAQVVIKALVAASTKTGHEIINTAEVTSIAKPPSTGDTRRAEVKTTVTNSAEVSLTKTPIGNPVAGEEFSWELALTNTGPSAAHDVTVIDNLPAQAAYVSANTPLGSCTLKSGAVTCNLGVLNVGVTKIIITARLAPDSFSTPVINNADVTTTTTDPTAADHHSQASIAPVQITNIKIKKEVSSGPIIAGAQVSYAISLTNQGPSNASAATIREVLPAGTTFSSLSASNDGKCVVSEPNYRCDWPAVAVGETRVMTYVVQVPATASVGTIISNTASGQTSTAPPVETTLNSRVAPTATVTGRVFLDTNRSGTLDSNETDISGVEVELLGPGADGKLATTDDELLQTVVTASPFVFKAVADGRYLIRVKSGTALQGLVSTRTSQEPLIVMISEQKPVTGIEFGFSPAKPDFNPGTRSGQDQPSGLAKTGAPISTLLTQWVSCALISLGALLLIGKIAYRRRSASS